MTKDKKNRSQYKIEEEPDSLYNLEEEDLDDRQQDKKPVIKSPMTVLFKIMFTPVEGWKALKRAKFKTDLVASGCFYPLIALAAICNIAKMFYESDYSFTDWAKEGLTTFITFFFGYFTVILIGGIILPRKSRGLMKEDIGRQLVMFCMSTLALFSAFTEFLPMIEPVLVFLPIWTIYLIFKGVRVIRVPYEVENSTTGYLCLLIILAPLFWNWLFTDILLSDPIK